MGRLVTMLAVFACLLAVSAQAQSTEDFTADPTALSQAFNVSTHEGKSYPPQYEQLGTGLCPQSKFLIRTCGSPQGDARCRRQDGADEGYTYTLEECQED